MVDPADLRALARRHLGRMPAAGAFREIRALPARLESGERVENLAFSRVVGGGIVGSQRLIVLTDRRVLLYEKGFVTGRERSESLPWARIRGVRAELARLTIELDDGEVELSWVQPADRAAEIADALRARTAKQSRTAPTGAELRDLARRKVGSDMFILAEAGVAALANNLAADERVLDLALATLEPSGLIAATDRRLVFVDATMFGRVRALDSWPYPDLAGALTPDPLTLQVASSEGTLSFSGVLPEGQAESLAIRIAARSH